MRWRGFAATAAPSFSSPMRRGRRNGWRAQLDKLRVPADAYDGVASSGDVTRAEVAARRGAVFHIGPERDLSIFTGLGLRFATVDAADYVVCSGLFDDETETPDDYRDMIATMRERSLFMVCANPDLVVKRGDTLLYCAGSIADLYREQGGEVLYAGKPHRPIYEAALAAAARARGVAALPSRTLAIGDLLRTDITGAIAMGFDGMFVIAGIHAEELDGKGRTAALSDDVRCRRRHPEGGDGTAGVVNARLLGCAWMARRLSPGAVMLRESGASSNPRVIGETPCRAQNAVWWLLDRPVEPGDDSATRR